MLRTISSGRAPLRQRREQNVNRSDGRNFDHDLTPHIEHRIPPTSNMRSNDEVERPRDDLWRAAEIVGADTLGIVRLALYASRIAPTDC